MGYTVRKSDRTHGPEWEIVWSPNGNQSFVWDADTHDLRVLKYHIDKVLKDVKPDPYGCGASTCTGCYPYTYGCANCDEAFDIPVPNGEIQTCEKCGFSFDPATNEVQWKEEN